ncbi:hypothetical protein Btru_045731 [Bulinus truncatus]|nr:hypothetical protein Btru_045731 [Bulinus truncatus]
MGQQKQSYERQAKGLKFRHFYFDNVDGWLTYHGHSKPDHGHHLDLTRQKHSTAHIAWCTGYLDRKNKNGIISKLIGRLKKGEILQWTNCLSGDGIAQYPGLNV